MLRFQHALFVMIAMTTQVLADEPLDSARAYIIRGQQKFFDNKPAESILDFNRAVELEPEIAPELWQRGISYYYTGEFQKGRLQFESHKTVNANDVENPAWHLLCVAQLEGIEAARKQLIKVDTTIDTREPMKEIYALYAGKGTPEAVLEAAEKSGKPSAKMYAHLYLGLYYEVTKETEKARTHMREAAAVKMPPSYMQEVARVHLLQRRWSE